MAGGSANVGPRSERKRASVLVTRVLGELQLACGSHENVFLLGKVKTANLVRQGEKEESLVVVQVVATTAVDSIYSLEIELRPGNA